MDGISYIFAGERELDLGLALEILNRELGIERLLLEGGGGSNGGLSTGRPDGRDQSCDLPRRRRREGRADHLRLERPGCRVPAPITSMTLTSTVVLEGGAVWLRYRLQNG